MIQWPVPIIEDKYSRWYEALMVKAQDRGPIIGYKEGHHIIPNSFIKNKNRVELTAREHYIAHLLLWRMKFPPKWHNKMSMALHVMVNGSGHSKQDRNYLIPSRIYESARHSFVQAMKAHFAEHGGTMKGKKHTPEALEKMRAWQAVPEIKQKQRERVLGEKNHMFGKHHDKEIRAQISAGVAVAWTKDMKKEKSEAMKEMWKDPEYVKMQADRKKISEGWLNRDWKAINRKAADTKMARGWKPSEESKRKLSQTRKAKIASGEIIPWNRGVKLQQDQISYTTYKVISPEGKEHSLVGRNELQKFCTDNQLGYYSMVDLVNGKQGKNRLYILGWKVINL
jgi:hypothetical protein